MQNSRQRARKAHDSEFVLPQLMYISSVSDIICPRCQGPASKGRGKPYCSKCGWNLATAESRARADLKQIPFTLLLFAGFCGLILYADRNLTVGVAVFASFMSIFLIYNALADWMLLRKVSELRAPISSSDFAAKPEAAAMSFGHKISETEFESWNRAARRDHERMLSLATPRIVRLSREAKIALAIIFAICVVALGVSLSELSRSNANSKPVLPTLVWSAMLLLFAYIGASTTRRELRKRRIIIEGEATLAKIVTQATTGGRNPKSKISYVFKDRAGKFYEGSDYDRGQELYEEMPVVVFYDPANPSNSVPDRASYWDIVLPPARIY